MDNTCGIIIWILKHPCIISLLSTRIEITILRDS